MSVGFSETTSPPPVAGSDAANVDASFYGNNSWTQKTITLPASAFSGKTMRLIFSWHNDDMSDYQPPAAIDDIRITAADIEVPDVLAITTASLPGGMVGVGYSQTLASNKDGVTWSYSGSLPNGLSLVGATGIISGTPTSAGTSNFTVTATYNGTTTSKALSITISSFAITTASLPSGIVGAPYSQTLTSNAEEVAWSVISGSLPSGLSLEEATGIISGTPTAAGTSSFTITATYGEITNSKALSITASQPTITFNLNGITYSYPPASITGTYGEALSEGQKPSTDDYTRTGYFNDGKWYTRTYESITILAESFESDANGWVLVNGSQTNKWIIGSDTRYNGSYSAYISNDGSTNSYNTSYSSTVHLYKDITFPESSSDFTLTFYFKGYGESGCDYMTVSYSNTSYTPSAGSTASGTQLGTYYNSSGWSVKTITLPASAFSGKTMRLIFTWINDYSAGSMPPAAIDDISISAANYTYTEFIFGTGGTPVTTNTTLYLKWDPTYTVSFNLNGGLSTPLASITGVVQGRTISTARRPTEVYTRAGYINDGKWYVRAGAAEPYMYEEFIFGNGGTPVMANTTLYLKWLPTYTVSFSLDGGLGTPPASISGLVQNSTLSEGQKPSTAGFTKSGYISDGKWYTRTNAIVAEYFEDGANGWVLVNGSQTNKWIIGSDTRYNGSYSAYISNDGSTNSYNTSYSSTVHLYKDITFPESSSDFTLTFYFKGYGESGCDYMTVSYSNTSYTPSAGSTASGTQLGTYYNSSGWSVKTITLPASAFSGKTMRLIFTWINDYSAGSMPPAAIDDISISAANSTYTEFVFGEDGTPVTANTTLYLKWDPTYTVSFNLNNGTGIAPASISGLEQNSTLSAVQKPSTAEFTRVGYINDGKWYANSAGTIEFIFGENGTPVTANTVLYLKWLPTYTVSFNLNGGTGNAPASISGLEQNSTLSAGQKPSTAEFTRVGYINDGKWYANSAGTTEFVFGENGTPVMANITLYLKWLPVYIYTISFNPNGGSNSASLFGTTNVDGTLEFLPTPAREGYDFSGWFTAAKNGIEVTTSTVFSSDATIYAQWTLGPPPPPPTPILPQISTGNHHIAQAKNGINLTTKTDATIEVYSLSGKLISKQSYFAGNHSISLGYLPKGAYIVLARFAGIDAAHSTTAETLRLTIR
ncbi:hypothetical protein R83H12_02114 [Fibrobacteria bacterium R8-3-H12]